MKIHNTMKHKIPWHMIRNKCARCGGAHAPWWGRQVLAPSCRDGSARENDVTMFLETLKASGQ